MEIKNWLFNLSNIRPPYVLSQERGVEWLTAAHVEAEKHRDPLLCEKTFRKEIQARIEKYGCKPEKVASRGHVVADLLHEEWERMEVYPISYKKDGEGFEKRGAVFAKHAFEVFEQFYPKTATPPDELIHVTCTGYNSPSAAQRLVAARGWEQQTRVTHAYHMGCMAAIPAVRMGSLFPGVVDVVHTEICSLHLNPSLHSPEQLVGQSLFADGFIRYTIAQEAKDHPAFEIIATHEELIPGTEELMKWECTDWGLRMTLAKEIPVYLARKVPGFVERLLAKAGVGRGEHLFAIHPGGPKIVELIARSLELEAFQIERTREVLHSYGNMSSSTLPHIWEKILYDTGVASGTYVIGLAFGPGLTMSGVVLKKETKSCG